MKGKLALDRCKEVKHLIKTESNSCNMQEGQLTTKLTKRKELTQQTVSMCKLMMMSLPIIRTRVDLTVVTLVY